jgi:ABC-type dipeptide/oligopeptide/nickel transport system ATPase subunit
MPLNLFVGRTQEIRRYQQFLTGETSWVLIIRGLGGSGKSTLLKELARQTSQDRDTCIVTLDFAQKTPREDYLTLLESFSRQVESYCDPERTVEFRKSIATGRYEIGKRIAGDNIEIGEINQEVTAIQDSSINGVRQTIQIGEKRQEALQQMRELSKEKFYAQMRTFTQKRLIIMLDRCEWLNETTGAEAVRWAVDELIPGLHFSMQRKGQQCFLVMVSCTPLQLNSIQRNDKEELELDMLHRAEVNQCLESMEVHDPIIQEYIYNLTYGHPRGIAIIYDILQGWGDDPLKVADLPRLKGLFYEYALEEIIDADVLKRLLKPPLDELTRYGVLLRRFNLPLLQAVFKEWLPEPEARNRFNQLIRYPHVKSLGDFNYYVFLQLLREILAGYIRVQEPEKWRRYHQLALEFLTPKVELPEAVVFSPDWYYHQLACDENKGVSYWNEMRTRAPREYIDALREAARDKALQLTLTTMQSMEIEKDATSSVS